MRRIVGLCCVFLTSVALGGVRFKGDGFLRFGGDGGPEIFHHYGVVAVEVSTPTITGVSGTLIGYAASSNTANVVTLTGTDFGTRGVGSAIWAPMEGTTNPVAGMSWRSFTASMVENVASSATNVYAGVGVAASTPGWASDLARFGMDHGTNLGRGSTFYTEFKLYTTIPYEAANLKWLRWWPTSGSYPNIYVGTQGDTTNKTLTLEDDVNTPVKQLGGLGYTHPATSTWFRHEAHTLIQNTAGGAVDGSYTIRFGSVTVSSAPMRTDHASAPGVQGEVSIQMDPSNYTPASGYVYWDEIVIDTTAARVWVSTSATYSDIRTWAYQPVKSWSSTSIETWANQGLYDAGDTVYYYVVKPNGQVNEDGFAHSILPTNLVSDYFNCDSITSGQAMSKGAGTVTIGASVISTAGVVGTALTNNNVGNAGGRITITTTAVNSSAGKVGFYWHPDENAAGTVVYFSTFATNPQHRMVFGSGSTYIFRYKDVSRSPSLPAGVTYFIEWAWDSAETNGWCMYLQIDQGTELTSTGCSGNDPTAVSVGHIFGPIDANAADGFFDQIMYSSNTLVDLYPMRDLTAYP